MNIVATANLKQFVDLARAGRLRDCLYDPHIYHCVYVKTPEMYSKVSVFRSGKMISTGTKLEKHAKHDLRFVSNLLAGARLIKPVGLRVKTQNIVATVELGEPVRLHELASRVPRTIYEPEQFPGAIHYPTDPIGVSILLFASGKAVIAGAKDMYELGLAAMELERITTLFVPEVQKLE